MFKSVLLKLKLHATEQKRVGDFLQISAAPEPSTLTFPGLGVGALL
jgi:hypothetical protein